MAEKETKTTWNHRIVKSVDDEGTEFFSIQEVYYEDAVPTAHTLELSVEGETVEEIKETLNNMLKCCDEPIIDELPMDESEEMWDDEFDGDDSDLTEDDFETESDDNSDEKSDTANKK